MKTLLAIFLLSAAAFAQSSLTVVVKPVPLGRTSAAFQFTASPTPALVGQPISFTVIENGFPGGPVPTGTVTFSVNGTVIKSAALFDGGITCTVTPTAQGTYTVKKSYSGDGNYFPN